MQLSKTKLFGVLMMGTVLTAPLWQNSITSFVHPDEAEAFASAGDRIQAVENVFDGLIGSRGVTGSLTIKQDLPFALPAMPIYTRPHTARAPIVLDINADGLSDLVYSDEGNSSLAPHLQAVLLNTGDGFEAAFVCVKQFDYDVNAMTYRGDCADL